MRTSTLAVLSFGSLLALAGCDAEDEALHGDDWLGDESVSFRCVGTGCLQSPYVGVFDISNMHEASTAATSPDGSTTVRWTALTKGGLAYTELRVTDLAKCEIRRYTAPWEGCEGAVIDLTIAQGTVVKTAQIKIESRMTDTGGALEVHKYNVLGNLDPLTGQTSGTFSFPVCPEDEDTNTRSLVMLPDVRATWTENNDDGLSELAASSNGFTLACNSYALAKGYTRGKVLPVTGGARNYGLAGYNAFTHAMRALYRDSGTTDEYSALTQHGTAISIKDLTHNPPLFDELDQSPPVIGYGVYMLESVYNAASQLQSGRKGATCKKAYVDFPCTGASKPDYPNGVHRRNEFSPPMTVIPGWSSLPTCNTGDLDDFGAVAVYRWVEGLCYLFP